MQKENEPNSLSLVNDLHVAATSKLVEALVQSESKMRLRLDLLSEVVFEINPSGDITFLNRAWVAVGGHKVESLRGKPFSGLFLEEDRPQVTAFIAEQAMTADDRAMTAGDRTLTCQIARPDGRECWVELSAVAVPGTGWVGTMRDVTRSKQALEQLELLSLVANKTDNFVIISDAQGLVRWVNRSFVEFTGYTLEEIYGRKPGWALQGPGTDPQEVRRLGEYIRLGKSVTSEILNYTKSGTPYWSTIHITPIFDARGALESFIAVQSNTTEMHTLNAQLAEEKTRAEDASEAKSQFLSNVSHEIRTPLNAVIGFLNLLGRTDLSASQTGFVDKMGTASRHLLQLINDILDFSKVEAHMMELDAHRFVIGDILQDVADMLITECQGKGLAIDVSVEPSASCRVIGDSHKLMQVLLNLTSNAVKFTEAGRVELCLSSVAQDDHMISVEFRVNDTGIGIDKTQVETIFDEFSQAEASTTRRFGGTGLGLAISQRLVQLMGGRIAVESARGIGSSFHFVLQFPKVDTLPLFPAAEPAVQPLQRQLAGLRILLVEDNEINQMVAREILKAEGAEIEIAANGEEGVMAIEAAPDRHDIILMDIHMPVMDGFEATSRILASHPKMRIVAMTANAAAKDFAETTAAGMLAHIGKPFDVGQLVETILRVIRDHPNITPQSQTPLSRPTFRQLRHLLSLSDMDALTAFEDFSSDHRFASLDWVAKITEALDVLDFDAALAALPDAEEALTDE